MSATTSIVSLKRLPPKINKLSMFSSQNERFMYLSAKEKEDKALPAPGIITISFYTKAYKDLIA